MKSIAPNSNDQQASADNLEPATRLAEARRQFAALPIRQHLAQLQLPKAQPQPPRPLSPTDLARLDEIVPLWRTLVVSQDWPTNLSLEHRRYLIVHGVTPLVAAQRKASSIESLEEIEKARYPGERSMKEGRDKITIPAVADQISGETPALALPIFRPGDPVPNLFIIGISNPSDPLSMAWHLPQRSRGSERGQLTLDVHPSLVDKGVEQPLVLVEDTTTADAIVSAMHKGDVDLLPISLHKANAAFFAPGHRLNPTPHHVLTKAWDVLQLQGRMVYFAWSRSWRTNPATRNALILTGHLLEARGAKVLFTDVPRSKHEDIAGYDGRLDMYLAKHSHNSKALTVMLAKAISLKQAEIETKAWPETDVGRGQRFADEARRTQSFLWHVDREEWMRWSGKRWARDDKKEAMKLAVELTERAPYDKNSKTERGLNAALNVAKSQPGISVPSREWDQDPSLLNTPTGTLDLRTFEAPPNNPSDRITRITTVGFDPTLLIEKDYGAPRFIELLRWAFGDNQETMSWFQRAVGMALFGQAYEDLLIQMHGDGLNGKSTLMKAIATALGDYARYGDPSMLTDKGATEEQLAELDGTRLLILPETNEGDKIHVASYKKIAGREPIWARFLYGRGFTFTPSHTCFLMTNHQLILPTTDRGSWRRMRLLPFTETIEDGKEDPDLDAKLAAEGPGILAWAIAGARDYVEAGYRLGWSEVVREATAIYRAEQNTVVVYAGECLEKAADAKVERSKLSDHYRAWCYSNGKNPKSTQRFLAELTSSGYVTKDAVQKSHGKMVVKGIKLVDDLS